jgi:hypothetical protein
MKKLLQKDVVWMDGLCLITSNLLHENLALQEIKGIIHQCLKYMKNAHNRDLIPLNALQELILPTPTLHEKKHKG